MSIRKGYCRPLKKLRSARRATLFYISGGVRGIELGFKGVRELLDRGASEIERKKDREIRRIFEIQREPEKESMCVRGTQKAREKYRDTESA